MDSEERYESVARVLVRRRGVSRLSKDSTSSQKFGKSDELRVNNRIFAMLTRGALVLKLPAARVDGLLASGDGTRFDAGKGRVMKEWLTLKPESKVAWLGLAEEAMAFVGKSKGR